MRGSEAESRQERIERIGRESALAEAPLLADLRAVGVDVSTVWAIKSESPISPYPHAIPVLMKHLDRDLPDNVKAAIARALAVPEASPIWEQLVDRFVAASEGDVKDGLAIAVARGFNKARLERALELVDDESGGDSRVLFIRDLKRIRDERVVPFLEARRNDPTIGEEIRRTLAGQSRNS